ncbi:SdrD B-like domain-containing protein, partial [Roseinatronobacter sp.]|uniref:DUF7507 domain-containing protein n=1 Tax=Roseinatronobacter sp. TaxID=1945755 RepID=UPI0025D41752
DIDRGFVENTATATGSYTDADGAPQTQNATSAAGTDATGAPVDPADQVPGTPTMTALTQEPGVLVTKLASPADVLPVAGETITYTITVENTGNVTLMDVRVEDPLVGLDVTLAALDVGGREVFTEIYVVTPADFASGQVINRATVQATSPDGAVVTGFDEVAVPDTPGSISGTVYIDINENGILDDDDIRLVGYTVQLFSASGEFIREAISDEDGSYEFQPLSSRQTYSITFVSPDGEIVGRILSVQVGADADAIVTDQNQSILIGGDLEITKIAGVDSVRVGDLLTYEISIRNSGTADVVVDIVDTLPRGFIYRQGSAATDGVPIDPGQSGQVLRFEGVTAQAGGVTAITLTTYVSTAVTVGTHINRARMFNPFTGAPIGQEATAAVRVEVDPVFQCSTVIGRVFDDINHDGYFNGEPLEDHISNRSPDYIPGKGQFWSEPVSSASRSEKGLPGVRLITPNGLAVTTDEHGRFSLPCAALPRDIGSNFMLKLDDRTLPVGYRMTTENPRVVRLTPGMLTKMNFGAAMFPVARVDLSARAFTQSGEMRPELTAGLQGLVAQIAAKPSVVRLSYQAVPNERDSVGNARLRSVEREIRRLWSGTGRYALTVERVVERPAQQPGRQ